MHTNVPFKTLSPLDFLFRVIKVIPKHPEDINSVPESLQMQLFLRVSLQRCIHFCQFQQPEPSVGIVYIGQSYNLIDGVL